MRVVVFDLDGTLIDSDPDILSALNLQMAVKQLPVLARSEVQGMIGDGAKVLVERAFASRGAEATTEDMEAFLGFYNANPVVDTIVYPGMISALEDLSTAGHKLAVCTNKPEQTARQVLDALCLLRYFEVITGGDSTAFRKPDPRHLKATLTAMGTEYAVMIGDHPNDINAAAGLGVPSIFVSWGYGRAQGTYEAHHPSALPELIARMG